MGPRSRLPHDTSDPASPEVISPPPLTEAIVGASRQRVPDKYRETTQKPLEVLFREQFRHDLRAGRFTMEFAQSAPIALQRIADAAGHYGHRGRHTRGGRSKDNVRRKFMSTTSAASTRTGHLKDLRGHA